MRARLAGLAAAIVVAFVVTSAHATATADPPICPNGTNWNNALQACR